MTNPNEGTPAGTDSESRREIDRIVALWVLDGKKGVDTPEVQAWLRENGYAYFIPKSS